MTIKQQGGIFGRNPEFNDLDVTGTATLDNLIVSGNTISTASGTNGNIVLDPDGTGVVQIQEDLVVNHFRSVFGSTNAQIQLKVSDDSRTSAIEFYDAFDGLGHAEMRYTYDEATPANENLRFRIGMRGSDSNFYMKENGDFDIEGNVVVANGKGIDFSATSGTGTSELFDDYEEGEWSPVVRDASSAGNTGGGTIKGFYTKTGRTVFINFSVSNLDTTGMTSGNDLFITGLPYAVATLSGTNYFTGALVMHTVTTAGNQAAAIQDATDYVKLYETISGAAFEFIKVSDISSGVSDIRFSLTYEAA